MEKIFYDVFHDYQSIKVHNENKSFLYMTKNKFSYEKSPNLLEEEMNNEFILNTKPSKEVFNSIFMANNIENKTENQEIEEKNCYLSKNMDNKNDNNSKESEEVINSSKNDENIDSNFNSFNSGRWGVEEHQKFIEGILKFGNDWKKVQNIIKTRSSTQARSHAQKFFLKLKKEIKSDILLDKDKLFDYIVNYCSSFLKSDGNFTLSNEQKEKLISVIKANLKVEKTEDDLNNQDKDDKGDNIDDIIDINEKEELANEDYMGVYKNKKNDMNDYKNKMSFDIEEKDKKIIFCFKKRKNTDLSYKSHISKIFNIKKDISHKNSMDISKSNDAFENKNIISKKYNDKNKNIKKININHHFIVNKIVDTNNNINNINDKNNMINQPSINNYNINNAKFYIQNNYYNIINNSYNKEKNNNEINIKNNYYQLYNPQNAFNQEIKEIYNSNNKTKLNDLYELEQQNLNIIFRDKNFFPRLNENTQEESKIKKYENEQNDPFNIQLENISVNDMKDNDKEYKKYYNREEKNEQSDSIPEMSNSLIRNN